MASRKAIYPFLSDGQTTLTTRRSMVSRLRSTYPYADKCLACRHGQSPGRDASLAAVTSLIDPGVIKADPLQRLQFHRS